MGSESQEAGKILSLPVLPTYIEGTTTLMEKEGTCAKEPWRQEDGKILLDCTGRRRQLPDPEIRDPKRVKKYQEEGKMHLLAEGAVEEGSWGFLALGLQGSEEIFHLPGKIIRATLAPGRQRESLPDDRGPDRDVQHKGMEQ